MLEWEYVFWVMEAKVTLNFVVVIFVINSILPLCGKINVGGGLQRASRRAWAAASWASLPAPH